MSRRANKTRCGQIVRGIILVWLCVTRPGSFELYYSMPWDRCKIVRNGEVPWRKLINRENRNRIVLMAARAAHSTRPSERPLVHRYENMYIQERYCPPRSSGSVVDYSTLCGNAETGKAVPQDITGDSFVDTIQFLVTQFSPGCHSTVQCVINNFVARIHCG